MPAGGQDLVQVGGRVLTRSQFDTCTFGGEKLVRDQPYELRYYPALPLEGLGSPLFNSPEKMEVKRAYIERVQGSIAKDGMRNPLTVEWFDPKDGTRGKVGANPRWGLRIGNNRYIALLNLGIETAPALVPFPLHTPVPELSGDYEVRDFMSALALFDAAHPWWHSYILRKYRPDLVPPAA